jgi:hypothetical protein
MLAERGAWRVPKPCGTRPRASRYPDTGPDIPPEYRATSTPCEYAIARGGEHRVPSGLTWWDERCYWGAWRGPRGRGSCECR